MFQIHVGEKRFSKKSKLNISLDQQAEFMSKKDKIVFEGFSQQRGFNVSYIKLRRGVVVITTAQPHSSRSELRGSAQAQTLLAACQNFAMLRISDNGSRWK